jgi:glycosyltransferase 2 family protein
MRNRRVWLGLGVSVAAILYVVRGISWDELVHALESADYLWLVPLVLAVLTGQLARAGRWRALFGTMPRPSYVQALDILNIGYLVSAVFPLRLGDPVRAWLADSRTDAAGAESFATVMAERAIDLVSLATLMVGVAPRPAADLLGDSLGPGPWADPGNVRVIALALVGVVYAAMLAVSALGPRAGRTTDAALVRLGVPEVMAGRLGVAVAAFAAGFAPLRAPRAMVRIVAWTGAVWLFSSLATWMAMIAFDLRLPLSAAVFALGATGMFAILPSSPGYAGVFHAAMVIALGVFAGVPAESALACAIVLHAVTQIVLVALGIASLGHLGVSRAELAAHLRTG